MPFSRQIQSILRNARQPLGPAWVRFACVGQAYRRL